MFAYVVEDIAEKAKWFVCNAKVIQNNKMIKQERGEKDMTLIYYIIGFIILLAITIEKLFDSRLLKITLFLLFCLGFVLGNVTLYQLLSL